MAKGKTNQPLKILVSVEWEDHPEIQRWKEQGHTLHFSGIYGEGEPFSEYDLIMGPQCYRVTESQLNQKGAKHVLDAIKVARKAKKDAQR